MTLAERVRLHRKRLGLDQAQLAKAVRDKGGHASQSTISDIEIGKSLEPRCVPQLAEVFGVTERQLRNGDGDAAAPTKPNVRVQSHPVDEKVARPPQEGGDKTVAITVMFSGRLAQTGRTGGWVIYPERAAGVVELGPVPGETPRTFKVEVLDGENSPVYEPRDILHCDPDKQALANNYCVFVGNRIGDDGVPALLGKLVRATGAEWTVKPYAGKELKLPRETWPHAWVVFRRDQAV